MRFSHLWMLRGPVLIISFLMTNVIFNYEITPCASHYLPSKNKSSDDQNFLTNYLNFVLNKSRELEQTIYSDVIDNLRTLVKVQNGEIESIHECSKNCENIKIEKSEYNDRNRAGSTDHIDGYATVNDMPLNGTEEKKGDTLMFSHFTPTVSRGFPSDSYFLGYSGNPFGNRNLIRGVSEMSQYDQGERVKIDPRKKRSVLHLYNMVLCSTGCNPFAYKGYGCYCGFLGSGIVVDGIDRCCKMHDWCYNRAGCPMFLEYFVPYLWKCYHRQPLCAINHEFYGSSPGSCSQRLCECDRQLAMCLRSYPCPTTKALCTSSPWRLLQNIFML